MSGRWTDSDLDRATAMRAAGRGDHAIGKVLGRSGQSVRRKFQEINETEEQRAARMESDRIRQAGWQARRRLAAARPQRPAPRRDAAGWFGKCPAFRPRTDQDANVSTRL